MTDLRLLSRWSAVMAAALVAPAAGSAQAGEPAPDTVIRLPALEVSVVRGSLDAERVPFAISRIEAEDLHPATPAVDLHEALRAIPGVVASNRYNLALDTRIAVRGFGARSAFGVRGVRILLDGLPLTLPDGQTMLTNVDLGSLGAAEVLRGPGAALYGNAAGGVIALSTLDPGPDGLAEAVVTTGSYGTGDPANLVRLQGNAGGGGGRDSWFVGVSHLSLQGYREHSRAERSGLNARYRRGFDDGSTLTAILHLATMPVSENPGSLPADSAELRPRMAWPQNVATASGKEAAQAQGGLIYARTVGPARIEAAGHLHGRAMDNPLPFGRHIQLRRGGGGFRAEARPSRPGPLGWTVGLDAQSQSDDRVERDNVAGAPGGMLFQDRVDRVRSLAPFGFIELSPAPRLSLRAGVRYDAVAYESDDRLDGVPTEERSARRTLDAWSGSAGATVELAPGLRAWSSVSTWFQTPTTTELINVPPAAGEACCQPGFNPHLEPQDGWGWEAGVSGRAGAVRWELVGFDLRIRNEILPFQVEGIEGREFFRNAGRATHRGLEAAAGVDLGAGWDARIAYALSEFRFVEAQDPGVEGNRLPGIPPHRLDARIRWRRAGTSVGLDAEWVDRVPADDANTGFAPDYAVLDLRAAHQVSFGAMRLEPFVAVTNLLDARYSASLVINAFGGRYFEPAPGRALLLGLRARFR